MDSRLIGRRSDRAGRWRISWTLGRRQCAGATSAP